MKKRAIKKRAGVSGHLNVRIGEGGEDLVATAIRLRDNAAGPVVPRQFAGYAAPMTWGPDVTVASHLGVVTYTISYEAVGDTLVVRKNTIRRYAASFTSPYS
jgi:hypothetical protein